MFETTCKTVEIHRTKIIFMLLRSLRAINTIRTGVLGKVIEILSHRTGWISNFI